MNNALTQVIDRITAFDPEDLMTSAGALQLMPENADRSLRLEALAQAAASRSWQPNQSKASPRRLRGILHSAPLGAGPIALAEDPFENPFTEAFTFHGGSFVVFPGTSPEETFILRHLCKALFLTEEAFPHRTFAGYARSLISAVLTISTEVARRAGLGRRQAPIAQSQRRVVIPDAERFRTLKASLRFTDEELVNLLQSQAADPSALEALTVPMGQLGTQEYDPDSCPLSVSPLVRVNDGVVVAAPGSLLTAMRNDIIRVAQRCAVTSELTERYTQAVWATVLQCCKYFDMNRIATGLLPDPVIDGVPEACFQFDVDKLMYTMLVTDALNDFDPAEPFGIHDLGALQQQIDLRLQSVQACLQNQHPKPKEILLLVVGQSIGRVGAVSINVPSDKGSVFLAMSAADLEIMMLLDGGDPLILPKFARASQQLRKKTLVVRFGLLDEYCLYRARNRSYYFSDDAAPVVASITPGDGLHLRLEAQKERDFHGAPFFHAGKVVEVTSLHSNSSIPIYAPLDSLGKQVALLVEGLPMPVWVIGPAPDVQGRNQLHSWYAKFADAVTFWLWQLTPSIQELLHPFVSEMPVTLELSLSPDDEWPKAHTMKPPEPDEATIEIRNEPGNRRSVIVLSLSILSLLGRPDNAGERKLMADILKGLFELLSNDPVSPREDELIARALDLHAPLGIKKKLLFLEAAQAPDLHPVAFSYRKIPQSDIQEVLDYLGARLRISGIEQGPIRREERPRVLGKAVSLLLEQLAELVADLSPNGLMESLMGRHEAIVRRAADHRLTLPTRLACFGDDPEMMEHIRGEYETNIQAGLAARFVIEYVAATPPQGQTKLSLATYDQLQACASPICALGFESDLNYYGLLDIDYAILPSGRLGADLAKRAKYEAARNSYLAVLTSERIVTSSREFSRYWSTDGTHSPTGGDRFRQIEDATRAEFGHSLSELSNLMDEATVLGLESTSAIALMQEHRLIDELWKQLAWDRSKIEDALLLLTLAPRDCFENPDGFKRSDVYPWRFNRPLSYLRRPFVRRQRGAEVEILWGPRHLHVARKNLVAICLHGRISSPKSAAMKQLIAQINDETGEAFNDEVADALKQEGAKVWSRVDRIGDLTLPDPDIDVLAVYPGRSTIDLIECKDLAQARTPRELSNQVERLFRTTDGQEAAVDRHVKRVKWFRNNLTRILKELGLDTKTRWRIRGLIVVDHEPFGKYFHKSSLPVIRFADLKERP